MRFSVIIPLYNKENDIVNTLESVLRQTYQDFEVIVVDDGSTDDSQNRARQVQDQRVQIICQSNQGVAAARNTGMERSAGEYIAFLDADDIWDDNYLETVNDLIERFPQSDIFVTAYRVRMGNGTTRYPKTMSESACCLESYWLTYQSAYDVVWTSATVIRKKAVIAAGMFTQGETVGEDLDLWARVAINNPLVAYSPQRCVEYQRCAAHNARVRVKVAYPKALLAVLQREMRNEKWSLEEQKWMRKKYDRKMMAYVYTLILSNKKKRARQLLEDWRRNRFCVAIPVLFLASFLPNCANRQVYRIRLRVF